MIEEALIKFEAVRFDSIGPLSFELGLGQECKIIACSNEDKEGFVDALTGRAKPASGQILIFGKDIYSISEPEYIKLFRKIAFVPEHGGLISNLKVWENIVLPALYHRVAGLDELQKQAERIFGALGFEGKALKVLMGRLPGPLSSYEKKIISLVRAMLMEPEIIIYDSLFDGLGAEPRERLRRLTVGFSKNRTSLYISANEASLEGLGASLIVDLTNPERFS